MQNKQKVVYYTDELNDEFSKIVITSKPITDKYKYIREGFFQKIYSFVMYRLLFMPFSYIALKVKYGFSVKNRKALKGQKGGYFIYANHTNAMADPFIPTFVCFPKNTYVIVHPANVSMPILGKINPYLGALPLPSDRQAASNFLKAIQKRIEQGAAVCIYPEAHIWPYCTTIRNFENTSFRYPIKYKTPVYCFTNVYTKRRFFKTPKITTYIDGPFFADFSLPEKQAKENLRNSVYNAMAEASKKSDYDGVIYKKAESENVD